MVLAVLMAQHGIVKLLNAQLETAGRTIDVHWATVEQATVERAAEQAADKERPRTAAWATTDQPKVQE